MTPREALVTGRCLQVVRVLRVLHAPQVLVAEVLLLHLDLLKTVAKLQGKGVCLQVQMLCLLGLLSEAMDRVSLEAWEALGKGRWLPAG